MPSSDERLEQKRRVVLVLDEDPRAARQAGLNLHGPHCNVLSSARYQEGLRIAARQKPDLILLETSFSGIDGLELAQQLRQAPETAGVGIAFLTNNQSVVKRVQAIRLGALDYIIKQVEGRKLAPQLKALLERLDKPRPTPLQTGGGDALLQALERVEQDSSSGVLSLERPGAKAHIAFELGAARRVQLGELNSEPALNAIATHTDWRVSFVESRTGLAAMSEAAATPRPPARGSQTDPLASIDRMSSFASGIQPRAGRVASDTSLSPERGLGALPRDEEDDDVDTDRTVLDSSLQASQGKLVFSQEAPPPPTGADSLTGTLPKTLAQKQISQDFARLPLKHGGGSSYEEDLPTNMLSKGSGQVRTLSHDDLLQQVMVSTELGSKADGVAEDALARWLDQPEREPLLLVFPQERLRASLRGAAEGAGYAVIEAATSLEGYTAALRRRPVAIISDVRGPKVDGRELLAAVRSDFAIRETPFLMVSGEYLFQQLSAAGLPALAPILQGLMAAISPRVELEERLGQSQRALSGRVGPIGTCTLLRALGAEKVSCRLRLQQPQLFSAEVVLQQGLLVEATVQDSQPATGTMALLNLVGYEWQDYSLSEEESGGVNQPALGEVRQLLSSACQQNNALLDRIYQQGVTLEELAVDRQALDLYLQRMPAGALKVLVRIVEGERAAELVQQGAASPDLLKSLLHELRRKGVIRLIGGDLQAFNPSLPLDNLLPEAASYTRRRRTHWLVVLLACVATVLLAAGGYYLYLKLAGEFERTTKSAAPVPSVGCLQRENHLRLDPSLGPAQHHASGRHPQHASLITPEPHPLLDHERPASGVDRHRQGT